MIDFAEIAKTALSHSVDICRELFPLGQLRGKEYVIGDLYGNKGDSLSVNTQTGLWSEFAGNPGGNDIISLVAAARNISQSEAAKWIDDRYGMAPSPIAAKKQDEFVPLFPVADPPENIFSQSINGEPTNIYAYHDRDGSLINFVCRYNVNGKKAFLPLTYGILGDKRGWYWKQLPIPRPLYRLELLPESGEIIVVEGEKAAEALAEKLPDYHIVTWSGGAQAVDKANWSPLMSKSYSILLWPDNDDAGKEAMYQVGSRLYGKVASIAILDVSELPPKGDAADWVKGSYELKNFLTEKRKIFKPKPVEFKPIDLNENALGFDPLQLPGLIGDTVRWIVKHAIFPQPELALLNTLAFAGSVFGRRWIGPTGVHTNVYTLGVAGTGQGKDHSRKMITQLAANSGLINYLGGNSIRSDTGMLRGLEKQSAQLLMLDEFGMWLEGVSNPRAPHHIQSVIQTLLTLYSSSGSVYDHGTYANEKENKKITIHNPVLCIYGTTTAAKYVPTLSKAAVESGQMGRFIVMPGKTGIAPKHEAPLTEDDHDLIAKWKDYAPSTEDSLGALINGHGFVPKSQKIEIGICESIKRNLLDYQTTQATSGKRTSDLWVRFWENTLKIAAIFSIARDKENPIHLPEDFEIARCITNYSLQYVENLIENHMAETEHEVYVNEFMAIIKKNPKGISHSDLTRRFQRLEKRKRDEIIAGLLDDEVIEKEIIEVPRENRGNVKKVIYKPSTKEKP